MGFYTKRLRKTFSLPSILFPQKHGPRVRYATQISPVTVVFAPSAHFPESARGREDPWLPSDCCRRSLSGRGLCAWKSSCRTSRILRSPESPGSHLYLHPGDNEKTTLGAGYGPGPLKHVWLQIPQAHLRDVSLATSNMMEGGTESFWTTLRCF